MSNVVSLEDRRPLRRSGGNTTGTRARFGNVRKLPSGRYQARYTGPDGLEHRAPVTFQTKGDATTWLAMQSAAITEHRWRPAPPPEPTKRTLSEYAVEWVKGRELKPRTRSEYTRILKAFTEAPLGTLALPEISPAAVKAWHASMDATKPTARAHAYALLRSVLNGAVEDELIPTNPAKVKGAGQARPAKPIRPASVAEVASVAAHMPERYRAMVHLAAWCAVRFGELTELRRHDVDLEGGVLRVRRAVTWVKDDTDKAVVVIGLPKSDAGVRDVTIPPHLTPILKAHLDDFAAKGADGLLFPNTEGGHMHHGSLYKVFRPARKAAGRPDLRWHDLRHTGATLAAQAGATTRELMQRLGHTTAGVSLRYQHVADGRAAELARKLSAMVDDA